MNLRRLLAPSLKVLPAIVIAVAALFQCRTFGEMARSKPVPDAVKLLARAETHSPREPRRGRALEAAGTHSKRDLDMRDLATRAVR
jgi:hypothetical protein